jgi:hypothetical protein
VQKNDAHFGANGCIWLLEVFGYPLCIGGCHMRTKFQSARGCMAQGGAWHGSPWPVGGWVGWEAAQCPCVKPCTAVALHGLLWQDNRVAMRQGGGRCRSKYIETRMHSEM